MERALAACGRRAGVRLTKRIPLGGGLGGGSADAAAVLRWAGCADPEVAVRLGADVPFCLVGGRARVEGWGAGHPAALRGPRRTCSSCRPSASRPPGSTGPGTRIPRHEGPNALTAAALAVEPRLARWRDALGEWPGREPVLAGSGSTWFVEAAAAEPSRADGSARRLRVGAETARLVRARTVPAGWEGD